MSLVKAFNSCDIDALVAIRCLDEGINIPSIKGALILSSNDDYREFVQRRGRILRKYPGKEYANIYDVIVLPSYSTPKMAEIEFRRFHEYAKLAINKDELCMQLNDLCNEYGLILEEFVTKFDDIKEDDLDD
jgi:superfamily II DNA or RNA helicase